jgi:hypothetical protein
MRTESVNLHGEWRLFVFVDGQRKITTPSFNCKGAAEAYGDLLKNSKRKPEYSRES